ncbi:helix-turn-helix domain-containing protein [Paraburkholderia sp. A2WS-5]|uniref:helix-turn-helix domain-containing protein n=1 Tax=unclassified Paraburkholderia TaxID=2615204 RepID=UPI003B7A0B69
MLLDNRLAVEARLRQGPRLAASAVSESQLPQTYFYINGPSDRHFPEQELIRLDKAGYTVALSRVAVEHVGPFVGTEQRTVLNGLLRRAVPGDELVVLDLACLGSGARDVLATLQKCHKEKIAVRCIEFGKLDLAGHPESHAIKMLEAVVRLEARTRSERSSTSLKLAQESGRSTGRPGSLSPQDREEVMDLLAKGTSISEIARRLGTSRQTIMRIRASTVAPDTAEKSSV